MKKNKLSLNAIREQHRQGNLEQAKIGYLSLLKNKPNDANLLHALGVIHAQQKEFVKAIEYLEKAYHHDALDPTIPLHLANIFKMQGDFTKAAHILEKALQLHPDYAPILNNLGTVYYAKEQFEQSIGLYQQALAKEPNYADAYYNLSLAFIKNGEPVKAEATLITLLKHIPDHFAAHFHLASAYMQQEKWDQAIETFLAIQTSHPHHFETLTNLATCYLKKAQLDNAKNYYLKALELSPDDAQSLFNLGYIYMQQGDIDNAIQYYQRTVVLTPDSFAAQNNLAVAFLSKPHLGLALQHFREALRIQPNHSSVTYTIQALEQNQPLTSAPSEYIESLFDAYADHYDMHLLQALDYQIPFLFEKIVTRFLPTSALDIVDLGCGTGLCASFFTARAKSLTGVDLSNNMLALARQKNIYTDLVAQDILTFLSNKFSQYDLILAGDVLVYLGDLSQLFSFIYQSLHSKGIWIFNTEINQADSFKMNQSGRFSHSKEYLEREIKHHQFHILDYQQVMTRQQNNQPVYGHVYVLAKR